MGHAAGRPGRKLRVVVAATMVGAAVVAAAAPVAAAPPPPVLVALGDSVTSGHHGGQAYRLSDGQLVDPLVCDDPSYGYPNYVYQRLSTADPVTWSNRATQYLNYAHSGFATTDVQTAGAKNACGAVIANAPLDDAVTALKAHAGSGKNLVVVTAGINDTNWVTLLTNIGQKVQNVPGSVPGDIADVPSCTRYITANWTLYTNAGLAASITANVKKIATALTAADPQATVDWLLYYNIAETGYGPDSNGTSIGPFMPASCTPAITAGQATINKAITDGLAGVAGTTTVAVPGMDKNNAALQQLACCYSTLPGGRYVTTVGWPHPTTGVGARILANAVPIAGADPVPVLPEAPAVVGLALAAAGVFALGYRRARRRARPPVA